METLLDERCTEKVIESIRTTDIFPANQAVFFIYSSLPNVIQLSLTRLKIISDRQPGFDEMVLFSYRMD